MLRLTNKSQNKEEIYQEEGKYPRITGTLTTYYFLPLTEFPPCFILLGRFFAKIFTAALRFIKVTMT